MRIRFLEIAQIELDEAIEYYNHEAPGLGEAFLTEVLTALDRIGKFRKHGTLAQIEREGVKPGVFPTDSSTKPAKTKS